MMTQKSLSDPLFFRLSGAGALFTFIAQTLPTGLQTLVAVHQFWTIFMSPFNFEPKP